MRYKVTIKLESERTLQELNKITLGQFLDEAIIGINDLVIKPIKSKQTSENRRNTRLKK